MAYTKQNFKSGNKLYATQLEKMEDGILERVAVVPQALNEAQMTQARANIGASAVSFERSIISGTQIGVLTINGQTIPVYAPTPAEMSDALTYSLSKTGNKIVLTGSNGSKTEVTDDNSTYVNATTTSPGLMSAADKVKLNSISDGADTVSFARSITTGTKIGAITINGSTTDIYAPTPAEMPDALTYSLSKTGNKIILTGSNGSKSEVTDEGSTYSNATTSAAGLMSAADKAKLDGIASGADAVSFSRSLTSGTKVGSITINGSAVDLYAPSPTSYSNATTTTAGLMSADDKKKLTNLPGHNASSELSGWMSAADKAKLDGIAAGADAVSFARVYSSGTKIGSLGINGTTYDIYVPTIPSGWTANTTGSGNAITSIEASGTTITAKKEKSFSLEGHTHLGYASSASVTGSGNAVTNLQLTGLGQLVATKGATFLTGLTATENGSGNAVTGIGVLGGEVIAAKMATFELQAIVSATDITANSTPLATGRSYRVYE